MGRSRIANGRPIYISGVNGTPISAKVRIPHTLLQRTRLSLCVPFFMSIFTASGPSPLFFYMKRLNCLPVILALISTTSLAEQDLPTYKNIPIWPEDGIIPKEWQDRYVFVDLDAGQMVLAYPTRLARGDARHYPEPFRIERFDLNNQVDASISVSVRRGSDSNFIYEYEVSNSSEAQAISEHPDQEVWTGRRDSRSSVVAWRRGAFEYQCHPPLGRDAYRSVSGLVQIWPRFVAVSSGHNNEGLQSEKPTHAGSYGRLRSRGGLS